MRPDASAASRPSDPALWRARRQKGTSGQPVERSLWGSRTFPVGDLLREHHQRAEQAVMERGDLLPDDVVSEVVFGRLAEPDA